MKSEADTLDDLFIKCLTARIQERVSVLELYDSVTGDLIAKAIDAKADNRRATFYTWANSATNKQAADRILKDWAEILVAALNEAHTLRESTGHDE